MGAHRRTGIPLIASLLGKHDIAPVRYEEELTLHFSRDELLDRHVILPHAEVNPLVYDVVNRFIDRYSGDRLTISIYCRDVGAPTQYIFREAFVSHYEDEYRRATVYLYRWYVRVILMALASVAAYYLAGYLSSTVLHSNFMRYAISNIGIYCLWEIGNSDFKRRNTAEERKRIRRARDAIIEFHA